MKDHDLHSIIGKARENNWRSLDLSNENITSLPDSIGSVASLNQLQLDNNALSQLPESIGLLSNLSHLSINNNRLECLPDSIKNLSSLSRLDLSGNNLTYLPAEIGELRNLGRLDLEDNKLSDLPENMGLLRKLQYLNLDNNNLSALPQSLGMIASLRVLSANNNKLRALPYSMGRLVNLYSLSLNGNRLSLLPEQFGDLANLHVLDIADNQLIQLPDSFGNIRNLKQLDLSGNNINELPESFGKLRGVHHFLVDGNALAAAPTEVLAEGSRAIMAYFRGLKSFEGRRAELNVFFLGEHGSGKTTLIQTLRGGNLPQIKATVGIDVQLWSARPSREQELQRTSASDIPSPSPSRGHSAFGHSVESLQSRGVYPLRREAAGDAKLEAGGMKKSPDQVPQVQNPPETTSQPALEQDMMLRLWDFGGNRLIEALHHLLFAERNLYVVVLNGAGGVGYEDVAGQLALIQMCVPKAQVLIAATHCEQEEVEFDFARLKARFDGMNIGDRIFEIDCPSGKGVAAFNNALRNKAEKLILKGLKWPKAWLDVEYSLNERLARGEFWMRRSDLNKIMEESGIPGEWNWRLVARLLSGFGKIVHFPDSHQLSELIIINPEKLLSAIARVMEMPELSSFAGAIQYRHLHEAWKEESAQYLPLMRHCMEALELCHSVPDDPDSNLMPLAFMPDKPRNINWSADSAFTARRVYYRLNTVPPDIMPRMITRTHRLSTGIYWRNGVFLQDNRARALCELDPQKKEITIEVRAHYPVGLLERLTTCVESLLAEYRGIHYQKYLGCPGNASDPEPCAARCAYGELHKKIERGETELICDDGHQNSTAVLVSGLREFADHREMLSFLRKNVRGILDEIRAARSSGEVRRMQLIELARHQVQVFLDWLWESDADICRAVPALIGIRPGSNTRSRNAKWFNREHHLRLYCQSERGIHPVGKVHTFKRPFEWWQQMPLYFTTQSDLFKVLSGPAGMIILPSYIAERSWQTVRGELEVMQEFLEKVNINIMLEQRSRSGRGGTVQDFAGEPLEAVGALVQNIDPSMSWNKSLHRVKRCDGRIRWVCEKCL